MKSKEYVFLWWWVVVHINQLGIRRKTPFEGRLFSRVGSGNKKGWKPDWAQPSDHEIFHPPG